MTQEKIKFLWALDIPLYHVQDLELNYSPILVTG